ncbi:MAG: adenylyl-sulfate kinase [Candidatus Aminicenantes bacterium]|nr:adenylyl-sulfate kinase [Candidatus Aminicenantes bacterium]
MKGLTVWFTGLPCSGKTTLALKLSAKLKERGILCENLDGDITRKYLSKGLGFSKEDRDENIRRVGFVCSLLTKHGAVTTAAFVSPYRSIRDEIRNMIGNFVEVYVKCPLETCIERDVKGMYKKAIAGEIKNFTGVSDPFEEPEHPELVVDTAGESEDECVARILEKLEALGYLKAGGDIAIPDYLRQDLIKILAGQKFPDLRTFVIHILSNYAAQHGGPGDISQAEEDAAREKLKKLGYLS